jgi:peptide/nickel transport system substrate-binding protein
MYAEPLYDNYSEDGEIRWLLATSMEEESDTVWIFHLREGVKFSNGNSFTADDVLFTLDLCCNTEGQYPYFPNLDFDACEIIDDYTIQVVFTQFDFSYYNNFTQMQILDAESYDPSSYASNPVGTGPYIVSDYVVNSHLYLTANEEYWGDTAQIQNLRFVVMNEDTQRVNALETGAVDVVTEVPLQDVDYVSTIDGYTVTTKAARNASSIWFNVTEGNIFNNVDARKAVCHAINKQQIINMAYSGQAEECLWAHSNSAADFDENCINIDDTYSIGYDVELAQQYADASGLTGQTVTLITNGASDYVTMAEVIQQNLNVIGVTVKIINYDEATFNALTLDTTQYDLYLRDVQAPTNTAAQNYNGWIPVLPHLADCLWLGDGAERFLELNSQIMSIHDESERAKAILEMTQLFEAAPAWYAICEANRVIAYNSDLEGVYYVPYLNTYYNDWSWK